MRWACTALAFNQCSLSITLLLYIYCYLLLWRSFALFILIIVMNWQSENDEREREWGKMYFLYAGHAFYLCMWNKCWACDTDWSYKSSIGQRIAFFFHTILYYNESECSHANSLLLMMVAASRAWLSFLAFCHAFAVLLLCVSVCGSSIRNMNISKAIAENLPCV